MGKRSNFKRVERDFYPTPFEAVEPYLSIYQKDLHLQNHVPVMVRW